MMGKVAKEFQAEGASLAVKQEDKLKEVMKKMNKVSGNALMFNTLRKKAIEVRQNIITQRELAGLAKDATLSRKVIEDLFPIPAPR
jgi:3-polyprenyl-4-hydroxybenzoate decarboxylase